MSRHQRQTIVRTDLEARRQAAASRGVYAWVRLKNDPSLEPVVSAATALSYPVPQGHNRLGLFHYMLDAAGTLLVVDRLAVNWPGLELLERNLGADPVSTASGAELEHGDHTGDVDKELELLHLYPGLVEEYCAPRQKPNARRYLQLLSELDGRLLEAYYNLSPDFFVWVTA